MFRLLLIFALFATFRPSIAESPAMIAADNFGEVAGLYLGTCEALKHLKQTECPKISLLKEPEVCMNDSINIMPPAGRKVMRDVLTELLPQLKAKVRESVPIGFKKVLQMANGDRQRACDTYGASMLSISYSQFEELKRLSKLLPNSGW